MSKGFLTVMITVVLTIGIAVFTPHCAENAGNSFVITSSAYQEYLSSSHFNYTVDENGAVIVGYVGANKNDITIPGIVDDVKVYKIGDYAFQSNPNIENLCIDEGVEIIGEGAFSNCSNLKYVTLSDTITTLGKLAFSYCYELKSVKMSEGLIEAGSGCFFCCDKLKEIKIPASAIKVDFDSFPNSLESIPVEEGNPKYVNIDGVVYNKAVTQMICGTIKNGYYSIPEGVKKITLRGMVRFKGKNNIIHVPASVNQFSNLKRWIDDWKDADITFEVEHDSWMEKMAIVRGIKYRCNECGSKLGFYNNECYHDGLPHSIVINERISTFDDVTVMYSSGNGVFDLTEPPSFTEIGTHTVDYKVTFSNESWISSADVIIKPSVQPSNSPSPTVSPSPDIIPSSNDDMSGREYSVSILNEEKSISDLKTFDYYRNEGIYCSDVPVDNIENLKDNLIAEVKLKMDKNDGFYLGQYRLDYDSDLVFLGLKKYVDQDEKKKISLINELNDSVSINSLYNKIIVTLKDKSDLKSEGEFFTLLFALPDDPKINYEYKIGLNTKTQMISWDSYSKNITLTDGSFKLLDSNNNDGTFESEDGFKYRIDENGRVTIEAYEGATDGITELTIPTAIIDGHEVDYVGKHLQSFKVENASDIKVIRIENGIKEIFGTWNFTNLSGLEKMIIPSSIDNVTNSSFRVWKNKAIEFEVAHESYMEKMSILKGLKYSCDVCESKPLFIDCDYYYDEKSHSVVVNEIINNYDDVTITYADENGEFILTTPPAFVEVGNHKVDYKIEMTGESSWTDSCYVNIKSVSMTELEKVKQDLEKALKDKEVLSNEKSELESENKELKTANGTLSVENGELKIANDALQNEKDKLGTDNAALQTENDKLISDIQNLNKQLEDALKAADEAKQKATDAQNARTQAETELQNVRQSLEQAAADKADAEAKLSKALEDKDAASAKAEQALRDKNTAEEKVLLAEKAKAEAEEIARLAQAEKEAAELNADQANSGKEAAEAKAAKALADKEAAEKYAEEQRVAAGNAQAKYEEQKALADKASEDAAVAEKALAEANNAIEELEGSLEDVSGALETALNESEEAKTALDEAERQIGRLTEEKENAEESASQAADKLDVLTQENSDLKEKVDSLTENNRKLQSENDKIESDNAALQNEKDKLGADNAALQTENEKLGKDNEALQSENEKLISDNEQLQNEADKLTADNEALRAEIERLNAEIEALKAEIAELRAEIDALKAEIAGFNTEIEALRAENESLKAENAVLKAENEEIFMSDKAVEAALKEARNDLDKANKELDKAEKEKAKAEEKLRKAEQNHSDSEDKLNKARADLEEAEARLINATAGKEAAEARISELLDIIEKQDSTARQALADKKAAEARARQAEADLADAEARANQAEANKEAAEARAEQAEADKAAAEARAEKAEAEKATAEAIAEKVLEEKETVKSVLDQIRAEIESAEAVLDELKSENESLAEENAALKAEAAEVSELIAEIGNVELTEKCRDSILAARTAYDSLTFGQKTLVLNSIELVAAEKTYEALAAEAYNINTDNDDTKETEDPSGQQTENNGLSESENTDSKQDENNSGSVNNETEEQPYEPEEPSEGMITDQNNEPENVSDPAPISESSSDIAVDFETVIAEQLPQTGVSGSRAIYVFALLMIGAGAYLMKKSRKDE